MQRLRQDEGATAILMAMVVVILVGMAAFAVDMGSMQLQNRELQNSADAGALAIAQQCAVGPCPGNINGQADHYAQANSTTGGGFFENTTAAASISGNSVTVTASGENKPLFRGVLGSGRTYPSRSATAVWGPPRGLTALPITISVCEYNLATNNNASFATVTPPTYEPATSWLANGKKNVSGQEQVLQFHDPKKGKKTIDGACPSLPSGGDNPGAFGWLEVAANKPSDPDLCVATTNETGLFPAEPGNDLPCDESVFEDLVGTTVALPIFDDSVGTGNTTRYDITGYAGFHLTGYHFNGNKGVDSLVSKANWNTYCSSSETCLFGYFVKALVTSPGEVGGGTQMGATLVRLTN